MSTAFALWLSLLAALELATASTVPRTLAAATTVASASAYTCVAAGLDLLALTALSVFVSTSLVLFVLALTTEGWAHGTSNKQGWAAAALIATTVYQSTQTADTSPVTLIADLAATASLACSSLATVVHAAMTRMCVFESLAINALLV